MADRLRAQLGWGRPGLRELAVLCRQLATMLGAGVPLLRALRVIERQSVPAVARLVASLRASVEAGSPLSAALAAAGTAVPPILSRMVATGEAGGVLDLTFRRLADHLDRDVSLRQKVTGAAIYPLITLAVAAGVVVLLVTLVVPNFARLLAEVGAPLPLPTRVVLAVSEGVRRFGWLLLPLAVAAAAAWAALRRDPRAGEALDRLVLRLPVLGPLRYTYALARFCRTLSTLLGTGMPVLSALEVVRGVLGNRALEAAVDRVAAHLRAGDAVSTALAAPGVFPPLLVEMAAVGEESGNLDEMLAWLADGYERELDLAVERVTATLQPLLIVLLGSVVGFIIVSVLLPMYDALQYVGG